MTGPHDPAAAGRGRLRAGDADREQAIDMLKTAFVHGQLTKDELDARAAQAIAARTHANLAALTADIPPRPPAARPVRPPAPVPWRPLARAAAKSGACLTIAAAAMWVWALLVSGDGPYDGIPGANPPMNPGEDWRFCWPLPPYARHRHLGERGRHLAGTAALPQAATAPAGRPSPASRAARRPQPWPGSPGPRTDQAQADLRADSSRQRQRHIPAWAGRASRGVRPTQGTI